MLTVKNNSNVILTNLQISEFVLKAFSEIKSNPDINALIHFHFVNKFLLMAHAPGDTRTLGNIVANHDLLSLDVMLKKYEEYLRDVLKVEPSIKSHANVLQKILGYYKKELTKEEKSKLFKALSDYRLGMLSLNDVLLSLEEITGQFQKTYLVRQTYFLLYARVAKP